MVKEFINRELGMADGNGNGMKFQQFIDKAAWSLLTAFFAGVTFVGWWSIDNIATLKASTTTEQDVLNIVENRFPWDRDKDVVFSKLSRIDKLADDVADMKLDVALIKKELRIKSE